MLSPLHTATLRSPTAHLTNKSKLSLFLCAKSITLPPDCSVPIFGYRYKVIDGGHYLVKARISLERSPVIRLSIKGPLGQLKMTKKM